MKLNFQVETPAGFVSGALTVFAFEKEDLPQRSDLESISPFLASALDSQVFTGAFLDCLALPLGADRPQDCLLLIGLGERHKINAARWRQAAAKAARLAQSRNLPELVLHLPVVEAELAGPFIEIITEGVLAGLYKQREFKTKPFPHPEPKKLSLICAPGTVRPAEGRKALKTAATTAMAVARARDWANQPANICFPVSLAETAAKLGQAAGLKVEVWDEKKLARKKLAAMLAVGRASANPPRLVILRYQGTGPEVPPQALVGKGITFDSGGLCLKPPANMNNMKTDMSGAANLLAVILAAAELKLKVNLVVFLALAENMPGGAAFRPGDVIVTLSGRTVEVVNTDAEGRLVLADALTLAAGEKPALIIDVATLTGACAVALGEECAGLFSNRPELAKDLVMAGETVGERLWPMPLIDEYEDALKSETADFSHMGDGPIGGAINAALFLRKFVDPELPWAHLDIAGPSRASKDSPASPVGATAFGVRTLLKFLRQIAAK